MTQESHLTILPCTAAEFGDLSADLLKMGKQVRFRATGTSMHPLVRNGDTLLISPCPPSGIRLGDIVLCTGAFQHVVVHRVIRRRFGRQGARFLIQGDQAPRPDGWLEQTDIYGRLEEITRDGNRITTSGRFRFLGLLIVLAYRLGLRYTTPATWFSGLLKHLPAFSGYLDQENN